MTCATKMLQGGSGLMPNATSTREATSYAEPEGPLTSQKVELGLSS
jgi:hypothetical protein